MAGLKTEDNLILFLGAITTIVTAIDTLFQIDAKRNTYKLMLFELRVIRTDFVLLNIKNNRPEKEIAINEKNELMNRYRKIIEYSRDLYSKDNEVESDK